MRSLLVFICFFGVLPYAFMQPAVAPLLYICMSILNPHKYTYGFAQDFPFALIAAIATMLVAVMSRERRAPPSHVLTYLLLALYVWMSISSFLTINPKDRVWDQWIIVSKTYLMVLLVTMLVSKKQTIIWYVYVLLGSVAFFGVKGGLFTIVTGGGDRVWGAPGSVIYGNNEVGLAIVMVVPLLAFLYFELKSTSARLAVILAGVFCAIGVLGTHSRGAALALGAMAIFLGFGSKRPFLSLSAIGLVGLLGMAVMPNAWESRMATIQEFDQDASALSRLGTWATLWRVALDHPFFGAGFAVDNPMLYLKYNPLFQLGDIPFGPHSIYFQALGEHGFGGLIVYVSMLVVNWFTLARLAKRFAVLPDHEWAERLCRMLQVGFIGFCSGGAFLGLMHWDVPYFFIALTLVMYRYANDQGAVIEPEKPRESVGVGIRYGRWT